MDWCIVIWSTGPLVDWINRSMGQSPDKLFLLPPNEVQNPNLNIAYWCLVRLCALTIQTCIMQDAHTGCDTNIWWEDVSDSACIQEGVLHCYWSAGWDEEFNSVPVGTTSHGLHSTSSSQIGRLCGLNGSILDHGSQPPEFEPRCWHIWRLFHFFDFTSFFGGRLAHLAYHVHKTGHKTLIVIK